MSTEQSDATERSEATERAEDGLDGGLVANAQGAVEVVYDTSESVDRRVAAIGDAASTQVEDMESVAADVTDLSATVEEIAASADEVSETTDRAATAASTGSAAAGEAATAMAEASAATAEVADRVAELEDHVARIDEVVDVIDRIADETNLLALNASIEAARAGDDGSGFGVVADEIKGLAAESRTRTEEIESAVDEIRSVTDEVADSLDAAVGAVETGADRVETAETELDTVEAEVGSAASGVEEVSDAVSQGAEASTRVADLTRNTADTAREIETAVAEIGDERAQTTDLLAEIDDALTAARSGRDRRLDHAERVSTGIDAFDADGGLPVGSRSVVLTDRDDASDRAVNERVAELCAAALDDGRAVSLSPMRTLDRSTLGRALRREAGVSVSDALAADRLFVLDLFGTWDAAENVIDVSTVGLAEANRRVDAARDRACVVVGNIAGELDLMGEQAVRENTYANDGDTLDGSDLVVNVVDEAVVPDGLRSFYRGAADEVCRIE